MDGEGNSKIFAGFRRYDDEYSVRMEVDRSPDSIRAQTDRVLGSTHFSRSGSLSRLLRFVVNQALEGKDQELKEYRLGVDVFERGPDFDPRIDPIVRMQAAKLRARLAEYYSSDGRADPIVISMPKGGYAPVFGCPEKAASTPAPAPPPEIQSIAVLPFVSMSPDPENEYFADGLTEELINVLTYVPQLRVVARTSAFIFKNTAKDVREIGAKLNVRTVLEGSVRRSGNQLRVTAQLIDVSTGYHLFSRTFPRELKDVFAVQEELASAVVAEIMPQVRGASQPAVRNQTGDLSAYDLYLKGINTMETRFTGPTEAVGIFRQALDRDPNFAPAWGGLAAAHILIAWFAMLPAKEHLGLSKRAALNALALDEKLGQAHAALATAQAILDWDWEGARENFERACALQPGLAMVHQAYAMFYLLPKWRLADAVTTMERALVSNPFCVLLGSTAMLTFAATGDFKAALTRHNISVQMHPNHPLAYAGFGVALEGEGRLEEAVSVYRKAVERSPGAPLPMAALGSVLARLGQRDEAERLIQALHDAPTRAALPLSLMCSALDDEEGAVNWMTQALDNREPQLVLAAFDPRFARVREVPRVRKMLYDIGLSLPEAG